MKVSEISKDYKFWRKVNLYITSLYKDYNFSSYIGSLKLLEAGVDTIQPIAYWTYNHSWFRKKSYFLYKKVESELSVDDLCEIIAKSNANNKNDLVYAVVNKCISIIKNIHHAGIRHDDPHGGNFLTSIKCNEIEKITTKAIQNSTFTLIDNDRCTCASNSPKLIKRFYDLKCLVRFNICKIPKKDLLTQYMGGEYNKFWWGVFCFWNSGGFNLKKRLSSSRR